MDISYKGIWGYAPLVISLANTKEILNLMNRPGNASSNSDSVERIDRAMELVAEVAGTVTVRGDTDFSNTADLPALWEAIPRRKAPAQVYANQCKLRLGSPPGWCWSWVVA